MCVTSGTLQRFAISSAREALPIVEPSTFGFGSIDGFVANNLLSEIPAAVRFVKSQNHDF